MDAMTESAPLGDALTASAMAMTTTWPRIDSNRGPRGRRGVVVLLGEALKRGRAYTDMCVYILRGQGGSVKGKKRNNPTPEALTTTHPPWASQLPPTRNTCEGEGPRKDVGIHYGTPSLCSGIMRVIIIKKRWWHRAVAPC